MKASLALDRADKNGRTPRQRYEALDQDYDEPEPIAAAHLLTWYWQLRKRMTHGPNGNQYLSWEAIDAWSRRCGESPEPWEISVIETLDDQFMAPADAIDASKSVAAAKGVVRSMAIHGRRVVRRAAKTRPAPTGT